MRRSVWCCCATARHVRSPQVDRSNRCSVARSAWCWRATALRLVCRHQGKGICQKPGLDSSCLMPTAYTTGHLSFALPFKPTVALTMNVGPLLCMAPRWHVFIKVVVDGPHGCLLSVLPMKAPACQSMARCHHMPWAAPSGRSHPSAASKHGSQSMPGVCLPQGTWQRSTR